MKILILGDGLVANGFRIVFESYGVEYRQTSRFSAHLETFDYKGFRDIEKLHKYITKEKITHLINCIGYTNVDSAEDNVAAVFRTNTELPAYLAKYCSSRGIHFTHISSTYCVQNPPTNVYTISKRAAEEAVALYDNTLIVRTMWVFGPDHKPNFLEKFLQRGALRAWRGEMGNPTYSIGLAKGVWEFLLAETRDLITVVGPGMSRDEYASHIWDVFGNNSRCPITMIENDFRKAKRAKYYELEIVDYFVPCITSLHDYSIRRPELILEDKTCTKLHLSV